MIPRALFVLPLLVFSIPAHADEPIHLTATEGLTAKLVGYLRVEGLLEQNDPNVDFVGRNDGFRLQNARIGVAGSYREKIGFRITADGADDQRATPNAINGTLRFALKDAYLDARFSPLAQLRAGQFHVVFDLDELTPQNEFAFADRSLESRGVLPGEGFQSPSLSPSRSLGVALRGPKLAGGAAFALGYELAAQNGNGENQSTNDNDSLAYSGALVLAMPGDSVIFAAARINRRTVGALPLQQTEEDLSGSAAASLGLGPVRIEGQAILVRTTYPTTGAPYQNALGAHAQALVRLPLRMPLEIGYRFAILDPSDLVGTDRVIEHTVGANLVLDDWRSKVQFAVTHVDDQRALDNDRAQLVFQVSL